MTGTIGLGSNLGHRPEHLRRGIRDLERAGLALLAVSSVWESEPLGTDAPLWFLNMAVKVRTPRHPLDLLDALLDIERGHGRHRRHANGPRTLDLDLLTLDDLELRGPRLVLPHPRMWHRRFVLEPLSEIAPELRNPRTGRSVAEEAARLRDAQRVTNIGLLAPA